VPLMEYADRYAADALRRERERIDRLLLDERMQPEDDSAKGWNLALERARAVVRGRAGGGMIIETQRPASVSANDFAEERGNDHA
jgi:hypothetical protein